MIDLRSWLTLRLLTPISALIYAVVSIIDGVRLHRCASYPLVHIRKLSQRKVIWHDLCFKERAPEGNVMRVADLMTAEVAECSPDDSIRLAARRMKDHHCGCLPVTVCDGGEKRLVGIITDRDLACRAVAQGLDPEKTEVASCMSFPVQTVARDADLLECADRFTTIGVRRLVVVDADNRCQGIISRADLQRFITDQPAGEQAQTAPQIATAPSQAGHQTVDDADRANDRFPPQNRS